MRVGVVGAGFIARRTHLPTLKSIPLIEIAGIADVNKEAAKRTAKKFQIQKWYVSFEELLNDDSIELIDICTPPQVRLEVIRLAAEKGKHVLVEKPLALSLKEALEIYQTVKEHDVKLNIVKNYRYFPSIQKVRERISGGYLGNIVTMQGSALTPHPADQTRSTWLYHHGGVLYDFAPHLIDMLLWINKSPPEKISAFGGDFTGGNMDFINYAQILLHFKNGTVAVADVSWLTAILGMRFTINIHGTGGHVLLDVRNDSFLEFHGMLTPLDELGHALKRNLKFIKGVITGSFFKGAAPFYKQLINDFIKSIRQNKQPPIPVEQGVLVNAILEAAEKSIKEESILHIDELFPSRKKFKTIINTLYSNIHP